MVVLRGTKLNKVGLIMGVLVVGLLSACHSHKSTVKNSSSSKSTYTTTKDGHYRVRKGDTLHAIAFKYGVDWRDIASLNHIPAPYLIYPDQQVRLPPVSKRAVSASSKSGQSILPAKNPPAQSSNNKPNVKTQGTTTSALKTPQASTTTRASTTPPATASKKGNTAKKAAEPVAKSGPSNWLWPTSGRIISNFKANDPARNGIDIAGKEGQEVIATAAGEVVYSGNGLIGYGELIIIKHNDRMLSAYAHNRERLVSEGQKVAAGAQIGEMGRNGRNQALLHFEIRINGAPDNPLKYLPSR